MCILCLWELTQRDSAAEVVLALFFFISMSATLAWASLKVVRIAKRSVTMHKNPAYILYSDPSALNKWGFLYVQFRATAYYFILPVLAYILIKSAFIAFAQPSGDTQAIALLLIETAVLIGVSILRPWMDKKTNTFNISIAAINFINVVFLLVFTSIFNQPVSLLESAVDSMLNCSVGARNRCDGCRLLCHQRNLRSCPAHPGPCCLALRNLLQESRHSVSTHAGRPSIVHQVSNDSQQRARRIGSDCPR